MPLGGKFSNVDDDVTVPVGNCVREGCRCVRNVTARRIRVLRAGSKARMRSTPALFLISGFLLRDVTDIYAFESVSDVFHLRDASPPRIEKNLRRTRRGVE